EQREARAELLVPLLAGRGLVPVAELLARLAGQRRLVRPCRSPVDAGREAVADRTEGRDLRRKEARLGDLADLHMLRVPLLRRLAPESRKVGRNRKRIEDLAVLLDEARDLRAVVVGSVLVRPGVDDRVPGLPEQRPERTADGVAVGVVRPHHGDLLVGRDLWPQVGVRTE